MFCAIIFLAFVAYAQAQCNAVSRDDWGARDPRSRSGMTTPVDMHFIHHTAGASCSTNSGCEQQMRNIQNYHMDSRGWNDIGYSFLVGGDGRVYEGRGWGTSGAHTRGYNSAAHATSFIGTFTDDLPTQAAMDAAKQHIACGVTNGYINSGYELFGHRNGGCTSCPGDRLYQEIQSWPGWSGRDIPKFCLRKKFWGEKFADA